MCVLEPWGGRNVGGFKVIKIGLCVLYINGSKLVSATGTISEGEKK